MNESAPRSTLPFFIAAFALTWLPQVPGVLASQGLIDGPVERFMPLLGLATFGPMFAALLAARFERHGPGVRALLRPLWSWRVHPAWYACALLLPGAIYVAGAAVYTLLSGVELRWFYVPSEAPRILALILFPLSEEIGWRGFAQPRLLERYGALNASLILGTAWALWHTPMFLMAGITPSLFPILFLLFLPASVLFTWIYQRTGGSLLLMVFLHAGAHLNNPQLALPSDATPALVQVAAYWVVGCAVVALGGVPFWRPVRRVSAHV